MNSLNVAQYLGENNKYINTGTITGALIVVMFNRGHLLGKGRSLEEVPKTLGCAFICEHT